ncbi:FACT complex subunit SSRP1-like isoform X2 [Watersipora subatra]
MVIFKNLKTGKVEQLQSSDVVSTKFMARAQGHCLKIVTKNGTVHKYDGFRESDFDKLSGFMTKCYKTDLEKVEMSVRGWNWGNVNFVGNTLEFEVHNKEAFEIPLGNVSHSTTSKNEVTLEFHQNDEAAVSLVEMRFHIPSEQNPEGDPVEEFFDQVQQKADIIQAVGESICNILEVQCLTPRGRYDIKLYPTFLQLHGKTFDYKIPYSTVIRLFLLHHKDGRQVFFVVSVDPPIKQGQTRYHFLIILFNKDDEMNVELALTEDEIEKKYDNKLSKEMSGLEYEIVSKLMKTLTAKKITVPGNFLSHSGAQSVQCSYKASNGFLYPLERGFIYVHKPPVHIRFDEVACVNFARSSGSTRSFDFDVETKAGTVYNFSSIEKDEYSKLFEFVKNKNLRVKNIGNKSTVNLMDDMLGSDDEDKHDAYLERMKREGEEVDSDENSDSSEDEDFQPTEQMSDVAEEYDSDVSSSDGEGGASGDEKSPSPKKKHKKASKPKDKESSSRKSKASKKSEKDPNAPKRAMSAYFLWLNESRSKIKADNPGISVTELSKKAGELWGKLSDRGPWEAKAVQAKKDYEKAMAEYKASGGRKSPTSSKKSHSSKSPSKKSKDSSSRSKDSSSKKGGDSSYKSKEFISDSSDSAESEKEPKAKKAKASKSKPAKPAKKEESEESADSNAAPDELPSEEEILSSPTASESSGSDSD